ncbi:NACHT domain-containing protein [Sphingomonas oryzagri]
MKSYQATTTAVPSPLPQRKSVPSVHMRWRTTAILDGFDEMKHGMTITMFERAFAELMKFDDGDARLLILGRDTAFHNDAEFNAIVLGRQRTALGSEIQAADRRRCRPLGLREFNLDEVASYVRRYFTLRVERVRPDLSADCDWIEKRIGQLLAPEFASLIIRPVHAQMLCEVATDPEFELANMTKLRLYDAFVHYLLHREIRKGGRDPRITLEARRRYNAGVAWWLWEKGGATTASLDSIPPSLALEATQDLQTDYDAIGLQRELAAGLLVEKGETALYFAHRSIQEFLVAENLLMRGLFAPGERHDPSAVLHLLNAEIIDFMALYFAVTSGARAKALNWINAVDGIRGKVPVVDLALPARLARERELATEVYLSSPWMYLLGFFVLQEATDFAVPPHRRGAILEHFEAGWGNVATMDATLTLMAHVLLRDPSGFASGLARILAAWLPASALAGHVAEARKGKSALAQVRREEDFRLWSFLQLVDVVDIDGHVGLAIDAPALLAMVKQQPIGFADDLPVMHTAERLQTTAQALYRALDTRQVKAATLDDIRPFFNDPDLRGRVRPLIVEHRNVSTQRRPAGARPAIGTSER